MIVPGMLLCSSFLISVCMLNVLKKSVNIQCNSDCSRSGSHLVDPFATVLFNVCSAVLIECFVWYTCCVGVLGQSMERWGGVKFV